MKIAAVVLLVTLLGYVSAQVGPKGGPGDEGPIGGPGICIPCQVRSAVYWEMCIV